MTVFITLCQAKYNCLAPTSNPILSLLHSLGIPILLFLCAKVTAALVSNHVLLDQKLFIMVTGNTKLDTTVQYSKMSIGKDEDRHKVAVSLKFLLLFKCSL